MAVIAEEVQLPVAIPPSLLSILAQDDTLGADDRPTKRQKVTKSGPRNIAQENGISSTGMPLGYIPLARQVLRMKLTPVPDLENQSTYNSSYSLRKIPVTVSIRNFNTIQDETDEQAQSNRESYILKLEDTGAKQILVFEHEFTDPEIFKSLEELNRISLNLAADRHFSKTTPTTCYQASIQYFPNEYSLNLEAVCLWNDSLEIPDFKRIQDMNLEVFARYVLKDDLPDHSASYGQRRRERLLGHRQPWSPREFYQSVHVPQDKENISAKLKCHDLVCDLFPFQRRAVRWLLSREAMSLERDGSLVPSDKSIDGNLPTSFQKMEDADGQVCYFSHLFMVITRDISQWFDTADTLRGGILAEEMGLGKTVEMIALITLNRRPEQIKPDPDGLRVSGATLIITPPAILEQWKQELEQHAPKLRVHHYTGIRRGQQETDDLIIEEIADFDVVLTTYKVISREIHYANTAPTRSLRHQKRFEPRKTPLVRISWWRVCLDEAQMIESGVSNAAKVARMIPRQNAWAVTGTPLRKNIDDLSGLLLFLHYQPFSYSSALWNRLYSRFGSVLVKIINTITLRHSKDRVRDELRLPHQKRIVITTPFTAIEEQHYEQLFEEMCLSCGLDAFGAPLRGDWNPDNPSTVEKMRTWLTRLRQTCLHPEVSASNRRALGASNGPLRTVDEVLEVMIENTDTSIRTEERAVLLSQLRRGQLLETAKRGKEALALWQRALDHSTEIVKESREQLRLQRLKIKQNKTNGEGPVANSETPDVSDDEGEEGDKNSRIGQCRLKLRSALEVQHMAVFFTANAYYQIKTDTNLTQPDSDDFQALEKKEVEGYEAAKTIRQEMLIDISKKVERYMRTIRERTKKKAFVNIPEMKPFLYGRGMESYRLLDKFEYLCDALNKHATQYKAWRDVMIKLVSQSLIDQEEDAELEGDEYERSTKHQDEMYVYMEALRSMFADRHDALTGQKNILISHEVKAGIIAAQKGEGPSPELFLSIMNTRSEIMPDAQWGSLRGIVSELRSLVTSLEWQASGGSSRASAELEMVSMVFKNASQMIGEQLKVSSNLEREVEMFRDTMNNRLEYYRHLQQISDTVAPYDEENAGKPMDEDLFVSKLNQEEILESKISSLKSKRRYLFHLRDDSGSEDNSRICIICQSSFEVGVLTVCGHKYCTDCVRLWWRQHKTCPMCKKPLKLDDFHQITYKPQNLIAQEEETHLDNENDNERHAQNGIYSDISTGQLKEIKNIDLDGSFGTKIDTLARHVLWLREHDPGTKSIIFSQYKNFLTDLQKAFQRFGIMNSSVDAPNGIEKFKKDPVIECFLLHGKAQSSGLTLINATHVFLCEPLINTAIELQAIARVHRIGQHRPTTVWMYLVSGTVEESIYELSVTRRLAHILQKEKEEKNARAKITEMEMDTGAFSTVEAETEGQNGSRSSEPIIQDLTETAIDSANSMELQDATLTNLMSSGPSGGEMVKKDDLWQCLFGNSVDKHGGERVTEAEREVGRFLRGEAAEGRRDQNGIPNGVDG